MNKSESKNLTMLKCLNCGSSVFEQVDVDTYKCGYCGSIAKDDNNEKQSFIKFLNSKSAGKSRIHIINTMCGEKEFYNRAVSYIALSKNSPLDVLSSNFSNVEIEYGYFLIVNAEFKVATLSNTYFDDVTYSSTENKSITINSEKQVEEDVVSETITICSPIHAKKLEGESEKFYKDLNNEEFPLHGVTITSEQLQKDNIKLPSKAKISSEIDRIVNETKAEIVEARNENNIRVMHKINQIDLYVVPKYVLKYDYNGSKYEVTSNTYDLNIVGTIPNDSENLYKQVVARTAKYPLVSITVSVLCAIFAIINLLGLRLLNLSWVTLTLIPIILFVFGSTYFINKIVTKSILQKRYNYKKQKLKEFLGENTLSAEQKEFVNSFEGGC